MMKKRMMMLLTMTMLTAVPASGAWAAEADITEGPTMSAPQMPGQGQMPQQGQMPGQGEIPQQGEMPQQGQMPQQSDDARGHISFDDLLKEGTISQETYDAIQDFMEKNKPELPQDEKNEATEQDNKTDAPDGTDQDEKPEDTQDAANSDNSKDGKRDTFRPDNRRMIGKGDKNGKHPDLLEDLLENEVITQEEYDAIASTRDKAGKADSKPADNQTAEDNTADSKAAETETTEGSTAETGNTDSSAT